MLQAQVPGIRQLQAQAFRPLDHEQGIHGFGFLFLLQEKIIGGFRTFQPIEVEMHQRGFSLGVMLCQGKGGAGDRLMDVHGLGKALHQRRFACPQLASQ